jgi:hypothetical protein
MYYAESLSRNDTVAFRAVPCKSYQAFTSNMCPILKGSFPSQMGFNVDKTSLGNFYLQTNSKSPFSRNVSGEFYRGILNT